MQKQQRKTSNKIREQLADMHGQLETLRDGGEAPEVVIEQLEVAGDAIAKAVDLLGGF